MTQVFALIWKEFLVLLKDPRGRAVLIGPPIIQLLLFGYAATFDVNKVPTAVINEDHGSYGRELIAHFAATPVFDIIAYPKSEAEAADLVRNADALLVLHIGQSFSRDIGSGTPAKLQLVIDGRRSNTALTVQSYANSIVAAFGAEVAAKNGAPAAAAITVQRAWHNENLLSRWFVVPALVGILTLVVTLVTTALSVARERELGTFDQLLVTALVPWQILLGKTIPPLVIGMFEGVFITALGSWWFSVPFTGSFLLLLVALFVYLLSASGVGLMISSLVATQQQAILGVFLFMVPAVILSGFATPILSMPDWIQTITLANPLRYFLVISRGVFLRDIGWDLALPQLLPMLLIGVVTLGASQWLFRHRLG